MPRESSTPLDVDRFLKEHTRNICPGCPLWVLFYRDKRGKPVYGCQIGRIPRNDECDRKESKRRKGEQ